MPEHVHLLLTGVADDSDLRAFMRTWKQATGYWYPQQEARPLWQGNYTDNVLREPEQVPFAIAYIVGNPVAAGLVERAADYKWLGSTRYSKSELIEIAESICPG